MPYTTPGFRFFNAPSLQTGSIAGPLIVLLFFLSFSTPSPAQNRAGGDSTLITVRVVHEGRPVDGAEIYRVKSMNRYRDGVDTTLIKIGRTGKYGTIQIPLRTQYWRIQEGGAIVAQVPDRLAGFARVSRDTNPDSMTIHLFPSQTVTGIVCDDRRAPVPGAEVVISIMDGDGVSDYATMEPGGAVPGTSARTDERGRFRLEGIPAPSRVNLKTSAPGYATLYTNDVPAGMDSLLIILEPESRITGRVVYETGKPAKGVRVHGRAKLFSRRSKGTADCVTDEKGRYSFEDLSAGMYSIYAILDSTYTGWVAAPLTNVGVGRGKTADGMDIGLIRGITVTGKLVEHETGIPMPGEYVSAHYVIPNVSNQQDQPFFIELVSARTDENGVFQLPTIPGEIDLYSAPVSGNPVLNWRRGTLPLRIKVDAGKPVEPVVLRFDRGKDIRGRVVRPDGFPAGGVIFVSGPFEYACSDEKGEFVLPGINGETDLPFRAYAPKGDLEAEFIIQKDTAQPVEVVLHPTEYVSVAGTVVDDRGRPIPGIPVDLEYVEGLVSTARAAAAVTDSAGRFTVDRIRIGPHYRFSARRGQASSQTFLAGKESGPFEIVLPRADRWLDGTVHDAERKPVSGMRIITLGSGHMETATDREGRFRLEGLAGERLELAMRGIQGLFHFQNIPTNQSRDFTLPTGRHFLSGRVTDTAGKQLAGAIIRIPSPEGGEAITVEADSHGCFHLSGFGYAEARLTAACQGYREKALTVRTDREDVVFVLEAAGKK